VTAGLSGAHGALRPVARSATDASGRLWEIDLARVLALGMMIAYHTVYDIDLLATGLGPDPFRGFWGAVPEATGSLFLAVAGVSLSVSDARMRARGASPSRRLAQHVRRAAIVMAAAVLVTVATRVAFDDRYVRFGILHAIAVGTLVCAVTVRLGRWNVLLGSVVLVAGIVVGARSGSSLLLPFGLEPEGFTSVDHWPLLPWLGPMLIGVGLGALTYPAGQRARRPAWLALVGPPPRWVTAPGRRSLVIYLGHQLLLIPLVWLALAIGGVGVAWPG
jgi:uncharacterized membrane protein